MQFIIKNEDAMQRFAAHLATQPLTGSVWLVGDLGAGKTTLTRYWLQALGHKGAVKSPTYTLVEPYQINDQPVYHVDLYRLQDPDELMLLGFDEYLAQPNSLTIIEWASKGEPNLPNPDLLIEIERNPDDDSRLISLSSPSQCHEF